ncbi:MAG: PepSY domain-containing protein [Anaerovoracaceae bacterium]
MDKKDNKKGTLIFAIVLVLTIAFVICFGIFMKTIGKDASTGIGDDKQYISKDKAKEIVLQDAKITVDDLKSYSIVFDKDERPSEYEIEFTTNKSEYEYTLKAEDGKILSKESKELLQEQNGETKTDTNSDKQITEGQAKDIAYKDAGINSDQAKFVKSKYEIDDGYQVYEVEFKVDGKEYEYKINAKGGGILDKSVDTY